MSCARLCIYIEQKWTKSVGERRLRTSTLAVDLMCFQLWIFGYFTALIHLIMIRRSRLLHVSGTRLTLSCYLSQSSAGIIPSIGHNLLQDPVDYSFWLYDMKHLQLKHRRSETQPKLCSVKCKDGAEECSHSTHTRYIFFSSVYTN